MLCSAHAAMPVTQSQRNQSRMDTLLKATHTTEWRLQDFFKNGTKGRNFFKVTICLQSQSDISPNVCRGQLEQHLGSGNQFVTKPKKEHLPRSFGSGYSLPCAASCPATGIKPTPPAGHGHHIPRARAMEAG